MNPKIEKLVFLVGVIFCICFLTVRGVQANTDVSLTWKSSVVILPAGSTKSGEIIRLDRVVGTTESWASNVATQHLKPGTKLPAVVYLHGCGGYNALDAWSLPLTGLGLAVFAPNSFARAGRTKLCGGGFMADRMRVRLEEAKFAREQIRKISWVDNDRVILMGFSEGGNSTADYNGDEYIAQIPIGTDCRHQGGSPYASSDTPVLNIVGSRDHWDVGGGCSISSDEKGSRGLVIVGGSHDVSGEREALEALVTFLDKCCGIRAAKAAFNYEKAANDLHAEFGELAPIFAFQYSEDALNSGDMNGHANWLKVRDLLEKIK